MCALRCPLSTFDRRLALLYALSFVCVHLHTAICVARINWMCEHRKWEWNQGLFSGTPLLLGVCAYTHTHSPRISDLMDIGPMLQFLSHSLKWAISISSPQSPRSNPQPQLPPAHHTYFSLSHSLMFSHNHSYPSMSLIYSFISPFYEYGQHVLSFVCGVNGMTFLRVSRPSLE